MSENKEESSSTSSGAIPKKKAQKNSGGEKDNDDDAVEAIRQFFIEKFNLKAERTTSKKNGPVEKVIDDLTIDGLAKHWKQKGLGFKNVITMVGAGISTSSGIPDFRSPGTGLYDNLAKYNLPYSSAIFEMEYFKGNPQPFFALAKELYPGTFKPTISHYFVRLLHEKGVLLRHYTQNIDTLERIAGIPDEKLVEAHGTFYTGHCLRCRKVYTMEWMKEQIFADNVPTCIKCNGIVKPDIVFFGEILPERFYKLPILDFHKCDLLIIMGTSLEVQPFASLVERPDEKCIRLLINRTDVGKDSSAFGSFSELSPKLLSDDERNTRDITYLGDCDDGVTQLADAIGWGDELRALVQREHARLATEKANELSKTQKDLKNDAKRLDEQDSTGTNPSVSSTKEPKL